MDGAIPITVGAILIITATPVSGGTTLTTVGDTLAITAGITRIMATATLAIATTITTIPIIQAEGAPIPLILITTEITAQETILKIELVQIEIQAKPITEDAHSTVAERQEQVPLLAEEASLKTRVDPTIAARDQEQIYAALAATDNRAQVDLATTAIPLQDQAALQIAEGQQAEEGEDHKIEKVIVNQKT